MTDSVHVDPEQLRRHAADVAAIRQRFAAVHAASAAITEDSAAYGLLCGWISGILEARHTRQNELIAYVEENLVLAAAALRAASVDYEDTDTENAAAIAQAGDLTPRTP